MEAVSAAAGHLGLKPDKALKVLDRRGTAPRRPSSPTAESPKERSKRSSSGSRPTERSGSPGACGSTRPTTGGTPSSTPRPARRSARYDLIIHEDAKADRPGPRAVVGDSANGLPTFPATDNARYRVFPIPFESPSDGDRVLVQNPADPSASPFGWHDTNGVAGPEFTVTRGNNVARLRRP